MAHPAPYLIKEQLVQLLLAQFKVSCVARDLKQAGVDIMDLYADVLIPVVKLIGFTLEDPKYMTMDKAMTHWCELEEEMLKRYDGREMDGMALDKKQEDAICKELDGFVSWLFDELKNEPELLPLN